MTLRFGAFGALLSLLAATSVLSGCEKQEGILASSTSRGGAGGNDANPDVDANSDPNPDSEWDINAIDDPDAGAESIDDWVFDTDSELTIGDSGLVATLVLGDVDFFSAASVSGFPASGFYLVETDGDGETETHLSKVTTDGDEVTVSLPDDSVSFTVRIEGWGGHVALHLLDMDGIGTDHTESLRLYLKTDEPTKTHTLNDLVTYRRWTANPRTIINWPYLWAPARPNGTHGSVVLYDGVKVNGELDELLAEIWAVQGTLGHMVHPAGKERWTRAVVSAWVAHWAAKFDDLASISLAPESKAELDDMTEDWVIPSGASRVYMFSTVWRGEYQLFDLRNESVEGPAFDDDDPSTTGKEVLLEYSEYLAEHGAHLQLKSLVPHLPRNDPEYFSATHCEDRFISWGSGTLVGDLGVDTDSLQFQPGPDYIWEPKEYGLVRIGNELLRFNEYSIDPGTGVWTLSDLARGQAGTSAHSFSEGDAVVGVVHSYSYPLHLDDYGQPNSLADEILHPYGDFLNEANVGHLHFDGTDSNLREAPWHLRDFTDAVYGRVEQATTGSRVGGSLPAHFERMFPMAAQAVKVTDYWGIRIGMRLDGMERGSDDDLAVRHHAPSMLDFHFDISDRILLGGRRPSFTAGMSGGRLTMEILDGYGMVDEAFALYMDWVELAPVYDDADAEHVAGFLTNPGNHYVGEDVLVLGKNSSGEYIYTPHRIMGEPDSVASPAPFVFDEFIRIDQEWGTVPRFQAITAGTTLTLANPYAEQTPQVVVRVDPDSATSLVNPTVTVGSAGTLNVTGTVAPGQYMKFDGDSTVTLYDANWTELSTLSATTSNFTVAEEGNSTVTVGGSTTAELWVQVITLGEVYVLESNKHL